MRAHTPEEICKLFQQVFVNKSGEMTKGRHGLREALAPLAAKKARFDFTIKAVIEAGDIALMHTQWTVSSPQPMKVYAIEVARRQLDGTWCWLIGDPYTIAREVGSSPSIPSGSQP